MKKRDAAFDDGFARLYLGNSGEVLKDLPEKSVHMCVTSPPYFGLRSYLPSDHADKGKEIGAEPTPESYVENMVALFREVRRVLRDDGTLWLNIGDSYAANRGRGDSGMGPKQGTNAGSLLGKLTVPEGMKEKDLMGIPWKLAEALKAPYYTGNIKAERDRVWLAATLDAEGCIACARHERKDDGRIRTSLQVTITNSSTALLDEAHRIWPASRVDHQKAGKGHLGKRDTMRWIATGADRVSLLLRELYPYLIVKKKQALLAYNFLNLSMDAKRLARSPQAQQALERRDWIWEAMSRLNKGGTVTVPSWCVEPPSVTEPGYYLRADIIWSKTSCMPESVTDRPTRSHEHLFLLAKNPRYFYDADAIREPATMKPQNRFTNGRGDKDEGYQEHRKAPGMTDPSGRNARDVWRINPRPYKAAHYAVFPPELPERCIKAGTSERGVCSECGAPWVRVVEREKVRISDSPRYSGNGDRNDSEDGRSTHTSRTVGWEPSCSCGGPEDLAPGDLEVIGTPTGKRTGDDPSMVTGRAGMNRPRGPEEGQRPITRYEQRRYALQLRESPHRESMASEAGPAFAHYIRTDRSGARPIPPALLDAWITRGWLQMVTPPTLTPPETVPATVLDPFSGSGTTLMVARKLGRKSVGIDIDERNAKLLEERLGYQGVLL